MFTFYYVGVMIDEMSSHRVQHGVIQGVYGEDGTTTLPLNTVVYEVMTDAKAHVQAPKLAVMYKTTPELALAQAQARITTQYDTFTSEADAHAAGAAAVAAFNTARA